MACVGSRAAAMMCDRISPRACRHRGVEEAGKNSAAGRRRRCGRSTTSAPAPSPTSRRGSGCPPHASAARPSTASRVDVGGEMAAVVAVGPDHALQGLERGCLRSSSIQRCSTATMASRPARRRQHRRAASCRASGAPPARRHGRRRKPAGARRAYGNSTSFTKEIELVVPSMSVRIRAFGRANDAAIARFVAREMLGESLPVKSADPAVRVGEEADRDEVRRPGPCRTSGGCCRARRSGRLARTALRRRDRPDAG